MKDQTVISEVSRVTGVPAKTIRFYEDEGLIPRTARNESGYRVYSHGDVRRLQFIRGARLLGVSLPQIKSLLDRALGDSCAVFGEELDGVLSAQLQDVDRRIAELTSMREDILRLQDHVNHCCAGCPPDQMASECDFCGLLTEPKGGEPDAREPAAG
jgi:DNA-binding transcriptional MerR regulator